MAMGVWKWALVAGLVVVSILAGLTGWVIFNASREKHPAISKSEGDAAGIIAAIAILLLLISGGILVFHTYTTEI
jgi:hypothetical protein